MTTDTRAALDAAIELYATAPTAPMAVAAWAEIAPAITAHVEAEVARRLAVAPGVEEALVTFGDAEVSHTHHLSSRSDAARVAAGDKLRAAIAAHVGTEVDQRIAVAPEVAVAIDALDRASALRGKSAVWVDRKESHQAVYESARRDSNEAGATLRAAIAADRERAVGEATDGAVQGERFAAAICRLVGARETGTGGQQVTTGPLYADAAKRIERMLARDKARLTPDEARRLVEEFGNAVVACIPAIAAGARGDGDAIDAMAAVIDRGNKARTALLRALGVEA